MVMAGQMRPFGRGGRGDLWSPGGSASDGTRAWTRLLVWQSTPHSLFVLDKKRTGRGRSKRKNRLAQNLRICAGLLKCGSCSKYVPTKFAGLLPARAGQVRCAGLAPRLPDWRKPRGGCRKACPPSPACSLPWRSMGAWQTGIEAEARQTTRPAPAERERKGIRGLPGGFHQSPTRGQGVFQSPHVQRVPVGEFFTWWHTFGRPPF